MSDTLRKGSEKEKEIEDRISNLNSEISALRLSSQDQQGNFVASGAALPDPEELKKLAKRAAQGIFFSFDQNKNCQIDCLFWFDQCWPNNNSCRHSLDGI